MVSSLIGARLYYVFTHYYEFRVDAGMSPLKRFFSELKNMFWPIGSDGQVGISGLTLYGGIILAVIVTALYLKKNELSIPKYMDLIAPSLGIGAFFTRIGCFLNGCCLGKPPAAWSGGVFTESSAAG